MAESLEELGASHLAHYFVKRLITTALDRKDREREMASTLLSSLYAEVGGARRIGEQCGVKAVMLERRAGLRGRSS